MKSFTRLVITLKTHNPISNLRFTFRHTLVLFPSPCAATNVANCMWVAM